MEVIKKKILQALTTGKTESSTGNTYIIIPDLTKVYNIKFLLNQDVENLGFFDVVSDKIVNDEYDYYYEYGYKNNKIMPSAYVTRAEMATMVIKAFGYEKSEYITQKFKDAKKIPSWAAGYINKAYELNIIKGYKDSEIKPNANLSRAEAFAVIERCMDIFE